MMTVVGDPRMRTLRLMWTLEELGLDYALEPAPPHSDAMRAVNPDGKVPALRLEDGAVLTDTTALCQFLADREGRLTNTAGTPERARQDGFTCFLLDEVEGPMWAVAKHSFALPKEQRVPEAKATFRAEAEEGFKRLERRLDGRSFAAGDQLTVADLHIAYCVRWADVGRVATPEAVKAFAAPILARPALAQAQARGAAALEAA